MSKTPENTQPIAVFDSGLGGVSVLKQLVHKLPHENFLYFGDSKNAPYGEKTSEQVRQLAEENIDNLINRGAKAVVIACNTATSVAANTLRQKHPEIPIIGMEPALKPAVESQPRPTVLIMATPLTIREQKFQQLADHYQGIADLIFVPCPGLAEAIETNPDDNTNIQTLLKNLIGAYQNKADAVVLGCTHYIHIKAQIAHLLGPETAIFDGIDGTVRELTRRLTSQNLLNSSAEQGTLAIEFSSSDAPDKIALAYQLLNRSDNPY